MKKLFFCVICMLLDSVILQGEQQYNRYKTWQNIESKSILESKSKQLESYYKQVNKQSFQKNFVRFNGKKVMSHTYFVKTSLKDIHNLSTYIVLSEFYIKWIGEHNDLDGVSVGGVLSEDAGEKKAQVRYFKFAQRYYTALHELGVGAKVYSYCAAPYITSCILIGIGEKW